MPQHCKQLLIFPLKPQAKQAATPGHSNNVSQSSWPASSYANMQSVQGEKTIHVFRRTAPMATPQAIGQVRNSWKFHVLSSLYLQLFKSLHLIPGKNKAHPKELYSANLQHTQREGPCIFAERS